MNSSTNSSSSLSSFVKQIKLLMTSNKSTTTTDTHQITVETNNNNYERCLFQQEYVSFPSLDEHNEHNMNYQEPSRFITESKPVLC
ncbi:hypothetical protein BJ944DRAFT_274118 [Cunninghamella echinulata]|nr:hypothetical protein BJ944DRAFT_274118 [Cunninghamella echinulata]